MATILKTPTPNAATPAQKLVIAGGKSNVQPKIPEVLKQLGVDPKAGLSSAEAQKRFDQYGPNALEEKKKNELVVFLGFFWDRFRG